METLTDEIRKARKQHRCNWCGNTINKGEKYRHSVNVDGGDIWSFKAHLKCDQIFDAFYKVDHPYWDECTAEYFEESAIEYLCLHVCPSCPLWRKTENYHGECGSPNWWRGCIDKLYDALVKEGRIEETWEPEKHVEELRKLIVKKATSLGVLSESDAARLEKLQCMRREYLPTITCGFQSGR